MYFDICYAKKNDVQMQSGTSNCGISSTSFGTALVLGRQPGEFMFDQREMRSHLIHCLENRKIAKFPNIKLLRRQNQWRFVFQNLQARSGFNVPPVINGIILIPV